MPNIDLSILNQRQTPAFYADVLANRPAAGFIGRIFVSTNTYEFYRDNGTGWDLIGGPGTGTITGGGSLYRVGIWTSTSNLGESNNLVFDYSTNRLGINTNTPGASLDVHSAASSIAQFNQTTATNNSLLVLQNSGSALWRIGNFYNSGANDFGVFDVVGAIQPVTIKKTTGQVLIGTSNVGSGKLVVASSTGDNGVQIVGASAPSLRIDNAETGPTKRAGLGIATALNNFIQGSADRDFCIFNGSTAAASPMLFGIYDAGLTNVQEAARISAARNFLVGTSVDAGFRLDINGTSRFVGQITANGNVLLSGSSDRFIYYNNTSTILAGRDGGAVYFGYNFGGQTIDIGSLSTGNIRFRTTGNTIVENGKLLIGTSVDAGFKLDVNGTARVSNSSFSGPGLQFAHTANLTSVITGGTGGENITFGPSNRIFLNASQINANYLNGVQTIASPSNTATTIITNVNATSSGLVSGVSITGLQSIQSSGFDGVLTISPNINASGGTTNAIVVGLYYNPTLTSLTGTTHRAIQTVTGDVVIGSTSGNLLIGTATSGASKLRIVGLPTSAVGLSSGDIYSNLGVLTIVP